MEYENYVVAFVDVLGTEANVKTPEDAEIMFNNLSKIAVLIDQERAKYFVEIDDYDTEMIIRTFSDNYFLAIKADDDDYYDALRAITTVLGKVTNKCIMEYGILIRGSITKGKMFISDNVIIGQALVDAYVLENTTAIYPRIIYSDNIDASVLLNSKTNYCGIVFKDLDGVYCINSMVYWNKDRTKTIALFKFLDKCLERYNNVDKVGIKYKWFANYLSNYFNVTPSLYPKTLKDIMNKYNLNYHNK